MLETWQYHNPVRITFGSGCVARLGDLLAGRSYALVTYREAPFDELAARVGELAGPPAVLIDNVATNPDFETLSACSDRFAAFVPAPEVIVALGGGSVIDAAKVLSACDGDLANVLHYLRTGKGAEVLGAIPIIAVPTTAGTGSEVTKWATVWNTEAGEKHSLSLESLFPEHALIDPELTLGLPRAQTISTGLDALSHALESLWNRNANPLSTDFAVTAGREILITLPMLVKELDNLELRTRMSRAALVAGLAFAGTQTALAHSLSYMPTMRHGVPHGIACSFSLPLVMRGAIGASEACDSALRRVFGAKLEDGADRLEEFLAGLEVSVKAQDHGMSREEWRSQIHLAFEGERGKNFIGERKTFIDLAAAAEGTGA